MSAASSKGPWLNGRRLRAYPKIFLSIYLLVILVVLATSQGIVDLAGRPLGTDFSCFYAASELALDGRAVEVWIPSALQLIEQHLSDGQTTSIYPWFYPPSFLLVVAPLALLPYGAALLAWLSGGIAAYLTVMRRILGRNEGLWAAAAFPAAFINLAHGQNGFLSAALLGGGLLLLTRRPMVAGLLFGTLAYKPHLAVLIPIALMAGGYWRALAVAGLTAVLVGTASVVAFGPESWLAFLGQLDFARQVTEQGGVSFAKMQTIFGGVRLLGGSIALGEPAAELPATAVALGAAIEVRSTRGTRRIAAPCAYWLNEPSKSERSSSALPRA